MRHSLCAMVATLLAIGCDKPASTAPANPTSSAPTNPTTARPSTAAPTETTPAETTTATTRAAGDSQAAMERKLNGVWVAEDVDAKMGQVKAKLTFRQEGPMKLAAWSDMPFVGQVRDKTAPYEVNGNVISSEAIRGGTSVEYRFEGDDLIIEYKEGKTVRFKRQ